MDKEQEFQTNLGNKLNGEWGKILGNKLIEIEQLKFTNGSQVAEIEKLKVEIDNLKHQLHEAEIRIVSAESKVTIVDDEK